MGKHSKRRSKNHSRNRAEKYGKRYTTIKGINNKDVNVKEITTKLKSKFACGGTAKADYVELQGDFLTKVKPVLVELGFAAETIGNQKMKDFLIGKQVKVIKANNKSLEGIEGKIDDETKFTFIINGKQS